MEKLEEYDKEGGKVERSEQEDKEGGKACQRKRIRMIEGAGKVRRR